MTIKPLQPHMLVETLGVCGLGLRPEIFNDLIECSTQTVNFIEVAPENWMGIGGWRKKIFDSYVKRFPLACHGLSLSIGAPVPLDREFLAALKTFLDSNQVTLYSEHLSYCSDTQGQLYDLMPMPFTEEAVVYVAERVRQVQETLERQIALENISYYAKFPAPLSESEFINAVLDEADCLLLLDVNNVYVNSVNHHYDAKDFIRACPTERVAYYHVAGHWQKTPELIIDTHGAAVIQPVWELLSEAYASIGLRPTLLERDNDVPNLTTLLDEIATIRALQPKCENV